MRTVSKDYDLPLDPPDDYFQSGWEREQEEAEDALFEELVDTEDEWCTKTAAWQILPSDVPREVAQWVADAVNENLRAHREHFKPSPNKEEAA